MSQETEKIKTLEEALAASEDFVRSYEKLIRKLLDSRDVLGEALAETREKLRDACLENDWHRAELEETREVMKGLRADCERWQSRAETLTRQLDALQRVRAGCAAEGRQTGDGGSGEAGV